MRKLFILLFLFIGQAHAESLTICKGEFALCAASTCKPTGKMITGTKGVAYPEVECRCPILTGHGIADLAAGNMTGSCAATDKDHVWSLFWPKIYYPQEASNFSKEHRDQRAKLQKCDASLNEGYNASNCFSWNCVKGKDGIAVCSCPMGQSPAATTFLTEAGQGNAEACSQHPVSIPVGN